MFVFRKHHLLKYKLVNVNKMTKYILKNALNTLVQSCEFDILVHIIFNLVLFAIYNLLILRNVFFFSFFNDTSGIINQFEVKNNVKKEEVILYISKI